MTKPLTEQQAIFTELDGYFNSCDSLYTESMAIIAAVKTGTITLNELRKILYGVAEEWKFENDYDTVETEEEGIDILYDYFIHNQTELFAALTYHSEEYGAPRLFDWIKEQSFETVVQYIEYLKKRQPDWIEELLSKYSFIQDINTFKHYQSNWEDRLKELIPSYRPSNDDNSNNN